MRVCICVYLKRGQERDAYCPRDTSSAVWPCCNGGSDYVHRLYTHIYIFMRACVYMYVHTERARERFILPSRYDPCCLVQTEGRVMYVDYAYICTYVYVRMCICMYIKRGRERYILRSSYASRCLV